MMANWLQIISLLFGLLGGGGAFVTYLLYSKQMKRIKSAEASEKEITNIRAGLDVMRDQISFQAGQIAALQKALIERETDNETLRKEKHVLEVKNSKNKSAMNKAYECKFCPDTSKCIVLIQRKQNEEDYLKTLCEGSKKINQ